LELGAQLTPRAVDKFDEFLPDHLLNRACATERLALNEAHRLLEFALLEHDTRSSGSSQSSDA